MIVFGSYSKLQWEVRLWTTSGSVLFELRAEEKCISVGIMKFRKNCTTLALPKTGGFNTVDLSLRILKNGRIQVIIYLYR